MITTAPHPDAGRRHGTGRDAVTDLVARWRADGTTFVVVDERGRHATQLSGGRLDLSHASALDVGWIEAVLHRAGYVLLDAHNVPRDARSLVLGRALAAVQRLRTRTGQPEWLLVEDAQDLLRRPGIPPHALRLADGGYALATRDGASPPRLAGAATFDVRVTGPGLELTLIPPVTRSR
jgi:hypothetical protein